MECPAVLSESIRNQNRLFDTQPEYTPLQRELPYVGFILNILSFSVGSELVSCPHSKYLSTINMSWGGQIHFSTVGMFSNGHPWLAGVDSLVLGLITSQTVGDEGPRKSNVCS